MPEELEGAPAETLILMMKATGLPLMKTTISMLQDISILAPLSGSLYLQQKVISGTYLLPRLIPTVISSGLKVPEVSMMIMDMPSVLTQAVMLLLPGL